MQENRQIAIERFAVLIASLELLEAQLKPTRSAYDGILRRLLDGEDVDAALRAEDVSSNRELLTTALRQFERTRHLTRVALIKAQVEEGTSISAASQTWGVSRQLASRYVNLPDPDTSAH